MPTWRSASSCGNDAESSNPKRTRRRRPSLAGGVAWLFLGGSIFGFLSLWHYQRLLLPYNWLTMTTTTTSTLSTTTKTNPLPRVEETARNDTLTTSGVTHVNASDDDDNNNRDYVKSEPLTIFYNIFIPPAQSDNAQQQQQQVAMDIVQEQVQSILQWTDDDTNKPISVQYATYGRPGVVNATSMKTWVQQQHHSNNHHRFSWTHLFHKDTGGELDTLTALHTYCQAHPTHRVVYLHSKGSYHNHRDNQIWRRHMLKAVLSHACLQSIRQLPKKCNVCGMLFLPIWTFLYGGNFWAASCDYVRNLRPPHEYAETMQALTTTQHVQNNHDDWGFRFTLYEKADWVLGQGRYAAEHWIGSHPLIKPCDMAGHLGHDITYWVKALRNTTQEYRHSAAPGASFLKGHWFQLKWRQRPRIWQLHQDLHADGLNEYTLLRGHIYRWAHLYYDNNESDSEQQQQQLFDPDSWMWKWFPAGEYWKSLVEQHHGNFAQVWKHVSDPNWLVDEETEPTSTNTSTVMI